MNVKKIRLCFEKPVCWCLLMFGLVRPFVFNWAMPPIHLYIPWFGSFYGCRVFSFITFSDLDFSILHFSLLLMLAKQKPYVICLSLFFPFFFCPILFIFKITCECAANNASTLTIYVPTCVAG